MNKKLSVLVLLATVLIVPVGASALTCGSTGGSPSDALTGIMQNIENALSAVGSALAIIGFIIAGIMWLTSAGNPERMKTAKQALIAAAIGCAVLALGQAGNLMQDIFCAIITN